MPPHHHLSVTARFAGGVKSFPAIIVDIDVMEEKEGKDKKSGETVMVNTTKKEAFRYTLKYPDGALETDVPRAWLTFDMRPYLTPEEGLYDEGFLHAPKEALGVSTIKNMVKKLQERHKEVGLARTVKQATPAMPGKKPTDKSASLLPDCRCPRVPVPLPHPSLQTESLASPSLRARLRMTRSGGSSCSASCC